MTRKAVLIPLFLLSACGMNNHAETALKRKNIQITSTETFDHCYGYGCVKKVETEFEAQDWAKIERIMRATTSAEKERENIKKAIGAFEQIVGEKTGTKTDKGGTFAKMFSKDTQQDCVDESLNTTIYLTLMQQKGLLKFHKVSAPNVRLPIIHAGRWPHQTAVMQGIESQKLYAVDSWFHDNGYDAEIVTLESWKDGWKPEKYHRN